MSLMRRGALLAVAVAFVGYVAGKVSKPHKWAPVGAATSALFPIKTPTRKDCSVTPYAVAERLGFLAEEGLRIQWTGETQPALLVPSILRGDNDVADLHPNVLIVAKASGASLSAVAEARIEPEDPGIDPRFRHMWWFINPERLPHAKSLADLGNTIAGRRIKFSTSTPNIGTDLEGKLLADKYGIPRERIEWISMPDGQAIEALRLGHIDVAAVRPHFYSDMEKAGARKVADSAETGLGRAAGVTYWTFRTQFIEEHPEEVAGWVRALRRAQSWANSNPEGSRLLTEEAIGQPVTGNEYYSDSGTIDAALATPWLQDLLESGIVPPGRVTSQDLVATGIAEPNDSAQASRSRAASASP